GDGYGRYRVERHGYQVGLDPRTDRVDHVLSYVVRSRRRRGYCVARDCQSYRVVGERVRFGPSRGRVRYEYVVIYVRLRHVRVDGYGRYRVERHGYQVGLDPRTDRVDHVLSYVVRSRRRRGYCVARDCQSYRVVGERVRFGPS